MKSVHILIKTNLKFCRASNDKRQGGGKVFEAQEHPLYSEYLSKLGDADSVREATAELRLEFRLQKAHLLRHEVCSSLSKNEQAIKDNFFTKDTALLEKLPAIESAAKHQRMIASEQGFRIM